MQPYDLVFLSFGKILIIILSPYQLQVHFFYFLHSVLESCVFLEIHPYLLIYPICWYIIVYNSLTIIYISVASFEMSYFYFQSELFESSFFLLVQLKIYQFCWILKKHTFVYVFYYFSVLYFISILSNIYVFSTASFGFRFSFFYQLLEVYNQVVGFRFFLRVSVYSYKCPSQHFHSNQ